jgi:hypothetical protein
MISYATARSGILATWQALANSLGPIGLMSVLGLCIVVVAVLALLSWIRR